MSIVDDSYSAVKYYKYNEYGKISTLGNTTFINNETYTGAVAEGGNLYYMNARFYNANTGRFLTQDTYRGNAYEPMSQNLYTYVGNNPIRYIDPTGHFSYDATGQQSTYHGSEKEEPLQYTYYDQEKIYTETEEWRIEELVKSIIVSSTESDYINNILFDIYETGDLSGITITEYDPVVFNDSIEMREAYDKRNAERGTGMSLTYGIGTFGFTMNPYAALAAMVLGAVVSYNDARSNTGSLDVQGGYIEYEININTITKDENDYYSGYSGTIIGRVGCGTEGTNALIYVESVYLMKVDYQSGVGNSGR